MIYDPLHMKPNKPGTDRRSFITRLTGMSALALVSPVANHSNLFAEEVESTSSETWDMSWLDDFRGKHKQVFDVGGTLLGEHAALPHLSPLHVPRNYLNAHKEVFGLAYPSINTAVGMTGTAYPINAKDAIWAKYSLGERWKINARNPKKIVCRLETACVPEGRAEV